MLVRPLNAACLKLSIVESHHPHSHIVFSRCCLPHSASPMWSVVIPTHKEHCAESKSLTSKSLLNVIPILSHLLLIQFPSPVTNPPLSREDLSLSEIANLIEIFNPTRYFKQILFFIIYMCIFYLFYFCRLKHTILQSSFSLLPLKVTNIQG